MAKKGRKTPYKAKKGKGKGKVKGRTSKSGLTP